MKVGDKLLCKKNLFEEKTSKIIFEVGEYYEIDYIDESLDEIRLIYPEDKLTWDEIKIYWFYLVGNNEIINNLFNYFYTEKELRKQKLEKIESRR